jgi:copper chaperone
MKTILRSKELTCPSCVAKIEKALLSVNGVNEAKVHFTTGRIEVNHGDQVDRKDLVKAVQQAGYEASLSAF